MYAGIKAIIVLVLLAIAVGIALIPIVGLWLLLAYFLLLLAVSIRIIQQYQSGIVFSLGKLDRTLGPGINFIFPVVEGLRIVDMRVATIDIPRQQAITKDNVPVTINGVLYFKVTDASKAIINVQDYVYAVAQYAQTALRDVIGGMTLDEVLAEREQIGKQIETIVEKESTAWGVEVTSIKMQDIDMPEDLKRLMSRQASSEREKRATIIKAEGDRIAAENLAKAASIMAKTPGAMQLRTLQTVDGLGPTPSNTVILAMPIEFMDAIKAFADTQKALAKKNK
jgi:regulator of protease activity HflC (stomatin/prohibitin superfamily)